MHRALLLEEILFNIFGHCSDTLGKYKNASLAVLARTCQAFKEPALDVLWEDLCDLSPLVQCLPEACCKSDGCYSYSRQPNDSEWDTLRGYARRVRHIRSLMSSTNGPPDPGVIRVIFTLAPFTEPLFPNLRSLLWRDVTIFPIVHAIVPSLTELDLNFKSYPAGKPPPMEFLDAAGERCRYMKGFYVYGSPTGPFDPAISRQVCRWANLQRLVCPQVSLSTDAILHLASLSTLIELSFTLSVDLSDRISQFGTILVFPTLSSLQVDSASLKSVTRLFSYIRLPGIDRLDVSFSIYPWKQDIQAYWGAVDQACPNTLQCLMLVCRSREAELPDLEEQLRLQLTLDDLPFHKTFHDLHGIHIDLPWSINLTDTDLRDLVYESPDLAELIINPTWGWRLDGESGGITLDGLIELLRCCPSLMLCSLVLDTHTFTHIPQGLDVDFSPDIAINFLDSYISPELVPRLVSVLTALRLGPWHFDARVERTRNPGRARHTYFLWNKVREAMLRIS